MASSDSKLEGLRKGLIRRVLVVVTRWQSKETGGGFLLPGLLEVQSLGEDRFRRVISEVVEKDLKFGEFSFRDAENLYDGVVRFLEAVLTEDVRAIDLPGFEYLLSFAIDRALRVVRAGEDHVPQTKIILRQGYGPEEFVLPPLKVFSYPLPLINIGLALSSLTGVAVEGSLFLPRFAVAFSRGKTDYSHSFSGFFASLLLSFIAHFEPRLSFPIFFEEDEPGWIGRASSHLKRLSEFLLKDPNQAVVGFLRKQTLARGGDLARSLDYALLHAFLTPALVAEGVFPSPKIEEIRRENPLIILIGGIQEVVYYQVITASQRFSGEGSFRVLPFVQLITRHRLSPYLRSGVSEPTFAAFLFSRKSLSDWLEASPTADFRLLRRYLRRKKWGERRLRLLVLSYLWRWSVYRAKSILTSFLSSRKTIEET